MAQIPRNLWPLCFCFSVFMLMTFGSGEFRWVAEQQTLFPQGQNRFPGNEGSVFGDMEEQAFQLVWNVISWLRVNSNFEKSSRVGKGTMGDGLTLDVQASIDQMPSILRRKLSSGQKVIVKEVWMSSSLDNETFRESWNYSLTQKGIKLFSIQRCRTEPRAILVPQDFNQPEAFLWMPQSDRFLVASCQYGRLSNQEICLRTYFHFAALLNRTLILPRMGFKDGFSESSYRWNWATILDASKIRACLQSQRVPSSSQPHVMTVEEYLQTVHPQSCIKLDRAFAFHVTKMPKFDKFHSSPGICVFQGRIELFQGPDQHKKISEEDLQVLRDVTDPIITLGTLFLECLEDHNLGAPAAPFHLKEGCGDLWAPHNDIIHLAEKIIQGFSHGQPFAALHMRRGDFAEAYSKSKTYTNLYEFAETLVLWLKPLKVSFLYIASDGSLNELQSLKSILQAKKLGLEVINLHSIAPRWERGFHHLEGIQVAVLEKYICSSAAAFLGTEFSTFSSDIARMRVAEKRASCADACYWKS